MFDYEIKLRRVRDREVRRVYAGRMVSETYFANRLDDLVDDAFMIVAVRESIGDRDRWRYMIPEREISKLQEHVSHGEIISVQRREPHGSFVVLAKLARVR